MLRHIHGSETLRPIAGPQLPLLLGILGQVPPLLAPDILNLDRPLSRAESEYEPVRRLAVVLLESLGLVHGGARTSVAFKVDLARLFERTLECAIRTQRWSKPPEFQKRPAYAGEAGERSAIDALVHREDGPLVVDAKYASAFSKGHLYQVLAYMKMAGAERGALVYPAGAEIGSRRYRGTGAERWEVVVHELDPVALGWNATPILAALSAALGGYTHV
ncbi:MAG: hypothetical protein RL385_2762 [Pseudomonadota bacterium]